VLIPMFTLSHSFSMRPLEISVWVMSIAVVLAIVSSLFQIKFLSYIADIMAIGAMLSYFKLIYVIYKTRPRKDNDVYAISLIYSYSSMLLAIALIVIYFISSSERFLIASMWMLLSGFFAFLITGHLYKIIPFLVWFEKFSPLVGKQKVPMLADMVPYKSSQAQFAFCGVGVVLIAIAIIFQINMLIDAGASFLLMGTLAFLRSVLYMINFK